MDNDLSLLICSCIELAGTNLQRLDTTHVLVQVIPWECRDALKAWTNNR